MTVSEMGSVSPGGILSDLLLSLSAPQVSLVSLSCVRVEMTLELFSPCLVSWAPLPLSTVCSPAYLEPACNHAANCGSEDKEDIYQSVYSEPSQVLVHASLLNSL